MPEPLNWQHYEPICDVSMDPVALLECVRLNHRDIQDGCSHLKDKEFELCMYYHFETFTRLCSQWPVHLQPISTIERPDTFWHILATMLVPARGVPFHLPFFSGLGQAIQEFVSGPWWLLDVVVAVCVGFIIILTLTTIYMPSQ